VPSSSAVGNVLAACTAASPRASAPMKNSVAVFTTIYDTKITGMVPYALIAILFVLLLPTEVIKAPTVIPMDSGAVVVSAKKGGRLWTASWTMEPVDREGKKAVRFTERGAGQISGFTGEIRWSLESVWSAETGFQPLESEKTISTPAGMRLMTERKRLDPAKGTLTFERQRSTGPPERKSMTIPRDTLIAEGIAGILRYLMFDQSRALSAHLLSNEPKVYSVTFENRGREHVKTSAGEVDCYKVEMVPHLGLLNVVRAFAPKTFFWFTVASPHTWVRYEGFESGPGTPEVVMELDRGSLR